MSGTAVPPGVAQVISVLQDLVRATWAEANNLATLTTAVSAVSRGFAITPSDTTVFDPPTRQIWVGGIGNLVVLLAGDTVPVTFANVPADTMLPLAASKVMAATTATLIVGLY